MHRETFITKLTEIQENAGQLLSQLQANEHDKFAAHLYRSRREYRSDCLRAGKGGKQIERCLISTFRVAERIGFKGDLRQWNFCGLEIEQLGVKDEKPEAFHFLRKRPIKRHYSVGPRRHRMEL
jgi:hypothetical protein